MYTSLILKQATTILNFTLGKKTRLHTTSHDNRTIRVQPKVK